jgi:integral membrane protein
VDGAITRYRVLANVVGVFLLLLCVGVIVKYGPPRQETIVSIVGPIHGFLYMVYLVTAFDLYRRTRWPLGRMVTMVAGGLVPFLAFVVERRIMRELRGSGPAQPAGGLPRASR